MAKINDLASVLGNKNVDKMLDLLAYTEGTDNLHGYNTLVGGKKIDDLSTHPNIVGLRTKDGVSTAFGRYQITNSTWRGLQKQYGFKDFSPENQDLAAIALIKSRGALGDVIKGDFSSAINKLGNEWVSLPTSTTKNQPNKSWDDVSKFLGQNVGNQKSTFDRVSAAGQPPQSQIANVYQAYKNGKMSPKDKVEFEQDVKDGLIMLPRGASLSPTTNSTNVEDSGIAPSGVLQAYLNGQMSITDKMEFEKDVRDGLIKVPKGFKLLPPPKEMSTLEKVKDFFTGESKQTSDTRMLPGIEEMPELNSFSWEAVKNTVGNIFSDKDEAMRIIKANSPNVQIKKDEKGNYLLKSAIDGKWYANQPGVRESGLTGLAVQTGIGALTGGGSTLLRAAGLGAASQAGVEGLQSAVGGEFDPTQVAIAGALGGAVPAAVGLVKAAKTPINNIIKRGVTQDIATLPHTPPVSATTPEVAPITPAATQPIYNDVGVTKELLPAQNLATTIRKASDSGVKSKAAKILAEQASPDPELLDSARRLGIEEYLQPDHITTNQVYRELAQAVKSNPGSEARASEILGLKEVAKRADDIITEIGLKDASEVSATIKGTMRQTQEELEKKADELYEKLRGSIPEDYRFEPKTVLGFIETQAKKVDGVENLTPTEKYIYRRLSPKAVKDMAGNVIEDARMPLYTNVDDVRKKIMSGNKGQGLFKDEDKGLLKKLYSSLVEDQATAAKYHGQEELFNTARETVKVRKSLEDDMQSLFGKELDRSMTRLIVDATKSLPAGDADKFVKLIKLVPEAQRKDTVAASLLTAFGKNARNGELNFNSYTNWFEGLQRNKQSYAAIMSNLPKESVQQLKDLYKVSKGISLASKERITTGRINAAKKLIDDTDTLMGNVYSAVKKSYVGAGLEFVTTPLGMPGAGVVGALSSALTRGKIPAMKKADELLASYEFQSLVKNLNTEARPAAVRKVANSRKFINFLKSIKVDYKNQSQRVKFLNSLLQATNNKRDKDASNKR